MLMMKCMFHRAFKGLALEMGVSKCHLESVPSHLAFSLQLLTSTMEDLLQVFMFYTRHRDHSVSFISNISSNLLNNFPNSSSWDTTAHGRTVSVSTLPVCRSGDYVLAADCINAWKDNILG